MINARIDSIHCTQDFTLAVFNTEVNHWQFRVIYSTGAVYGERNIYYTKLAAERAGRKWIQQLI
ncbi:MAG: hypothetical protein HC903_28770 [Methylacidiphilales bacterium]|nr:hypothetical protein [Candidatus Methylacidiphilales bacterium]NJR18199.1 hypothetical protein [Calothrix sp. CSU_2_0]